MQYWTDYPIIELGDEPNITAPVRKCLPTHYDGDKYCRVKVGGIVTSFKSGYIYEAEGRCGVVPAIRLKALHALPRKYPA